MEISTLALSVTRQLLRNQAARPSFTETILQQRGQWFQSLNSQGQHTVFQQQKFVMGFVWR